MTSNLKYLFKYAHEDHLEQVQYQAKDIPELFEDFTELIIHYNVKYFNHSKHKKIVIIGTDDSIAPNKVMIMLAEGATPGKVLYTTLFDLHRTNVTKGKKNA